MCCIVLLPDATLTASSATVIAEIVELRSRSWPGSQDTRQMPPGPALSAKCGVRSLVIVLSVIFSVTVFSFGLAGCPRFGGG